MAGGNGPLDWSAERQLGWLVSEVNSLKKKQDEMREAMQAAHAAIRTDIRELRVPASRSDRGWSRFTRQLADLGPIGIIITTILLGLAMKLFGVDPTAFLKGLGQ